MNNQQNTTHTRQNAPRRKPADKDPAERNYRNLLLTMCFPLVFLYLEFVLHIGKFKSLSGSFFVYSALASLVAGLLCAVICTIFSTKANYWITVGILGVSAVYFSTQFIYDAFFKDFFYWELMGQAGNVTQFWREALKTIFMNIVWVILFFLPMILFMIFGKKRLKPVRMGWTVRAAALVLSAVFFIGGIGYVNLHDDIFDDKYYYNEGFFMTEAIGRFGVLTSLRLDTKYTLFGHKEVDGPIVPDNPVISDWGDIFDTTAGNPSTQSPSSQGGEQTQTPPDHTDVPGTEGTGTPVTEPQIVIDRSPQVMNIDFEGLINACTSKQSALRNAHTYFSTRTPTNKNEYTGMFKGKNLIFITVESWFPSAIQKDFTPMLYKMKNEGFVFENYYCSNWGGSTATGEYANITGNFYNSVSCLPDSAKTYQPFTLGNMFKSIGVKPLAFHDWTYTYYGRDKSHPNFGYNYSGTIYAKSGNYKTSNNWGVSFTRAWPLSDRELADYTVSFIPDDGSQFHIYYMTVSGHPNQTFAGNSQAKKHKPDVLNANLPYKLDLSLSYVACQYEVELMVERLCAELEAKGCLEDTVFVMCPDHYPYQLSEVESDNTKALAEMTGLPEADIYLNYQLYRCPLIIWSPSMKQPVKVPKVCSAIDVLPTVLNLFGFEYDSRLIMGQDILSDSDGFVILNMSNKGTISASKNWITDYGFYSSRTKTFTPFPGVSVDVQKLQDSGYISHYTTQVANMYTYSFYILNNNYYKTVFPKGIGN